MGRLIEEHHQADDLPFYGKPGGRNVLGFQKKHQLHHISGQKMNKKKAIELLSRSKAELQARFGVTKLALFGSTARGTATNESDIDVLVAFDGPATSKRYFGVQFYLEDLFGCPVDLVTEKALRSELRPFIEQEQVNV